MRRQLVVLVSLTAGVWGLSACGEDGSGGSAAPSGAATSSSSVTTSASASPGTSASASPGRRPSDSARPSPSGTSIDITIKGGKVTPNGDRIEVEVDEPVTLNIDADTSGELHVHSTPEQEIEFPEGSSTRRLTITKPGIVDVEDHALEQVIVQLQAS